MSVIVECSKCGVAQESREAGWTCGECLAQITNDGLEELGGRNDHLARRVADLEGELRRAVELLRELVRCHHDGDFGADGRWGFKAARTFLEALADADEEPEA